MANYHENNKECIVFFPKNALRVGGRQAKN